MTTSCRRSATAPLIDLVGSADKHELRLDAGHMGLVVGRTAAKTTVPTIIDFLRRRSDEVDAERGDRRADMTTSSCARDRSAATRCSTFFAAAARGGPDLHPGGGHRSRHGPRRGPAGTGRRRGGWVAMDGDATR